MEKEYFRLICIDENDPLEYRILVDENKENLEEVHKFVKNNFHKYQNAKWLLLPATVTI